MHRFFSKEILTANARFELDPAEAHHLRDSVRLKNGSRVHVFDGRGSEWICVIEGISGRSVYLTAVEETVPQAPESSLSLTLGAGFLKNTRFDLIVQKAVELGVTRLVPVISERCESPKGRGAARVSRWKKIVIESSKQCGRATLMAIREPMDFGEFVREYSGFGIIFTASGGGEFPKPEGSGEMAALVGSEGGWTESETEIARAYSFHPVTLGGRTLRAETAAIVFAALVQNRYGDLA